MSSIPTPTLKRLPMYYRELQRVIEKGVKKISSTDLGVALELPPTQVRKDLSFIADQGRPGVGYHPERLANTIKDCLSLTAPKKAALVGVGNLAHALIHFPGFQEYGLEIHYLFDNDAGKVGSVISGITVQSIDKLTETLKHSKVPVGIITVPSSAAQQVADAMSEGGVRSIWNFAPLTIKVPDTVFVLNQDLSVELAVLSYQTTHSNDTR
ncbi:MAG: redox-sensing transcriptional repressor Rex [Anaerolineae bacterium]|nr:redox-sensing transcriptional repressor Rex [Anaerolineae bacterium]